MSDEKRMQLPRPPVITKLDRISPTTYEAALKCTARAAWAVAGDRGALAPHPRALLGIAVHSVLEKARTGGISNGSNAERREQAERLFDNALAALFEGAHPLLRAKFEGHQRLPFYNLFRARAAQMAADAPPRSLTRPPEASQSGVPKVMFEKRLESKDGRIVGRSDVLDAASETVVDYKTGSPPELGALSDSEARQLRLYAFLAGENGVTIRKGVIERADRTRAEIKISAAEAAEEGRNALAILDAYNSREGRSFADAASPSSENCRYCPCIPFCEAFWNQAQTDWGTRCGVHVEGEVIGVEGSEVISIELLVRRGSGVRGPAVVTRLSRTWVTIGDATAPSQGEVVRVTDASYVVDSAAPAVLRADRVATAVWLVKREQA